MRDGLNKFGKPAVKLISNHKQNQLWFLHDNVYNGFEHEALTDELLCQFR